MRRLFLLCTAALCMLSAAAQPDYMFDRGVAYRDSDDAYVQRMCRVDVARPAAPSIQRVRDSHSAKVLDPQTTAPTGQPVIVWFHGGGLTGGSLEVPAPLLKTGCVVVGVGYRLSPEASVPEIIDDAAAAVAWVLAHAGEYGGDPSRIYLAGHSAGGYLVNMIGLDKTYLARYGVDADTLAAIVPFSGQTITHFEHRRAMGMDALRPLVDSLAPLYHVRGDAPPMLIISGDRELELFGRYEETAYFWRMLKLQGHKDLTFYEVQGFDHGSMCQPAFTLLADYIKKRAKR